MSVIGAQLVPYFAPYIAKHISRNVPPLAMKESLLARAKNKAAIPRALPVILAAVKGDLIDPSGKKKIAAREILLPA